MTTMLVVLIVFVYVVVVVVVCYNGHGTVTVNGMLLVSIGVDFESHYSLNNSLLLLEKLATVIISYSIH